MILELLTFIIILGIITTIVARGGFTGRLVLILISFFVGTVLGGMLVAPIIIATIIYYEFNLILILLELVVCIFAVTCITFLIGLVTMKSEN